MLLKAQQQDLTLHLHHSNHQQTNRDKLEAYKVVS